MPRLITNKPVGYWSISPSHRTIAISDSSATIEVTVQGAFTDFRIASYTMWRPRIVASNLIEYDYSFTFDGNNGELPIYSNAGWATGNSLTTGQSEDYRDVPRPFRNGTFSGTMRHYVPHYWYLPEVYPEPEDPGFYAGMGMGYPSSSNSIGLIGWYHDRDTGHAETGPPPVTSTRLWTVKPNPQTGVVESPGESRAMGNGFSSTRPYGACDEIRVDFVKEGILIYDGYINLLGFRTPPGNVSPSASPQLDGGTMQIYPPAARSGDQQRPIARAYQGPITVIWDKINPEIDDGNDYTLKEIRVSPGAISQVGYSDSPVPWIITGCEPLAKTPVRTRVSFDL